MLTDTFNLAIIPISLGVSGLVFLGIALFLRLKYGYRGGIKSSGILVGFRKLDNDHYIGAVNYAFGHGKSKDFNYNVPNSKPIIRFYVDGRLIEIHTEWSVSNLGKEDIGRSLPIRYYPINGGKSFRVVLDGKTYEQQRNRGRKIIFWIFAGIGIGLIILSVLVLVLYFYAMKYL